MDIGSKEGGPAGRLSNFTRRSFVFDGIPCQSLEGALQGFKFKNPDMQREVCSYYGYYAKKAGKKKRWWETQTLYHKGKPIRRDSEEYQILLDRLYQAAYDGCPNFRRDLYDTRDATYTHVIGKRNKSETVLTQQEFTSRLERLSRGERLYNEDDSDEDPSDIEKREDGYSIAFTGHRPKSLPIQNPYNLDQPYYHNMYLALLKLIVRRVKEYGSVTAYSGMALGSDTVWAHVILKARDEYPDKVRFVAAIPDYNQGDRWIKEEDKKRWSELLDRADEVVDTSSLHSSSSYAHLLQLRNLEMIASADELIAIYDENTKKGGSKNAVESAKAMGKKITIIHPKSFLP